MPRGMMISKSWSVNYGVELGWLPTWYMSLRLHISRVRRFDKRKPLLNNALDISTSLADIAQDLLALSLDKIFRRFKNWLTSSPKTNIHISFYKDLRPPASISVWRVDFPFALIRMDLLSHLAIWWSWDHEGLEFPRGPKHVASKEVWFRAVAGDLRTNILGCLPSSFRLVSFAIGPIGLWLREDALPFFQVAQSLK